jgi:hypothetical protein
MRLVNVRNILVSPIVLLVRAPMLLILRAAEWTGDKACRAADWIDLHLPAFERRGRRYKSKRR